MNNNKPKYDWLFIAGMMMVPLVAAVMVLIPIQRAHAQDIGGALQQPVTGAAPTGAAGGVLSGTYPNPGIASTLALTNATVSGFESFGTNPAASGMVRLPNTGAINARNAANNGDLLLLDTTAGNILRLGASGVGGVELTVGNLYFVGETSSTPLLHSSGATIQALLGDQSARANFQVAQINSSDFKGQTNCASAGGTCVAAPVGSVSIAAAATTVTVASTIVTANSAIILTFDSSLGTKLGVTCNTTQPPSVQVSTRTPGTSFVITATASVTNPACFNYLIVN